MRARLGSSFDSGEGPLGRRTLNTVASGEFHGARLKGHLSAASGDWMLTRNRVRIIDARVVLVVDDGAHIHMSYGGRATFSEELESELKDAARRHAIDPARYYFRTTPVFETGAPQYAWMNGIMSVGIGRLIEGGLAYDVFELT
jgi:hypothetical protein